jgi:hypothetical protein
VTYRQPRSSTTSFPPTRGSGFSGVRPVQGSASSIPPPPQHSQPATPMRKPNEAISTVSSTGISPSQQVEPATPVRPASDSQVSGAQSHTGISGDGRKLRDEMGM